MTPPRPRLLTSFRTSARLLASRFGALVALGAAVVASLLSVCCGVGLVASPWLLCELYALQLSLSLGSDVGRSRAWLGAGAILLGAVLLVASVGWLTSLGLGATPGEPDQFLEVSRSPLAVFGALVGALSAAISLAFVLPFLYAPVILIDQRSGVGGAVLESARLVLDGGAFWHLALSFVQNSVQVAPLWLAALLSALADPGATVWWVLASLPLISLTLPLGQGMVVASYVERRHLLADPSRARVAGRPPRLLATLWALLVLAPLVAFGLLGASLVHPARLSDGPPPAQGQLVATLDIAPGHSTRHYLSGTALQLTVDREAVVVSASDGGGAGRLPLRHAGPVERVHVRRVRDSFAIGLRQGEHLSHTRIDRAGVRLDDDLRSRLADRLPPWALGVMLLSLLATAVALLPVLASFARVRRLYTLPVGERPAPERVSYLRARSHRRAALSAVPLALLSAGSLYFALEGWLRALGL